MEREKLYNLQRTVYFI
ncbi:unnamed protein product, partial [Rotaria sp. Silwood1]